MCSKFQYSPDLVDDPGVIIITPDRKFHAAQEIWWHGDFKGRDAFWYLLKLYEILEAARTGGKLPKLRSRDLQLQTTCWSEDLLTRMSSTVEGDILSVDWSGVAVEFHHPFYAR
jgi:hypothetical protein